MKKELGVPEAAKGYQESTGWRLNTTCAVPCLLSRGSCTTWASRSCPKAGRAKLLQVPTPASEPAGHTPVSTFRGRPERAFTFPKLCQSEKGPHAEAPEGGIRGKGYTGKAEKTVSQAFGIQIDPRSAVFFLNFCSITIPGHITNIYIPPNSILLLMGGGRHVIIWKDQWWTQESRELGQV